MKQINDKTIIKVMDTFDDAAILYYHAMVEEKDDVRVANYDTLKGRLNYYECLIKVMEFFLEEDAIYDSKLDDDTIDKINELFLSLNDYIEENGLNSEELRKALFLLDIKAFKNVNFSVDIITPDNACFIVSKFVETLISKKNFTMLDFNFGTGNLAFSICNNLDREIELIGVDNHPLMASIAQTKGNLLQTNLTMYYQDALEVLPSDVDIVVSDLAGYEYNNDAYDSILYQKGVRYFPYLAIEHFLLMEQPCKYVYIIDGDFFSQEKSDVFKAFIDEYATIKAFVTMPVDMFKDQENIKAILVLENKKTVDKHIPIYMLPPLTKQEEFLNVIKAILNELKA